MIVIEAEEVTTMTFEEWWEATAGHISISDHEMVARYAWEAALASIEEDIEHRVNAAWQTGYDAGRGVE